MRDNQTLDAMLGTLGAQDSFEVPDDFMTGVWQRAGQLGEIVERRRRMALFAGLFVVGLSRRRHQRVACTICWFASKHSR